MSLCFPAAILDQHLVLLGKTGSGKSSALRHIVEHLLSQNKRVCIVDPKGDWWGLKVSADGRGAGFPVVLFGDFKNGEARDVPINDRSGKHIADLITSGNRPCIIGMRGWTQAAMTRFWIDFASTLFASNAGELYLVVDEFHNFAPKGKILSPEAGMALHWSNRLLSEGRGLGIVCLDASQRPQKVHNDSLTSHETLVAMRVIHKADRDAVKDWIDGAGDSKLGTEVLNSLASMPRGEAWIWSPEIGFGPKRVKFPMFTTFDSFAPPQLQKRVSNKGWATVDLTAVTEKLAQVIQEEKANDPKALRAEMVKLQAELVKLKSAPAPAAPAPKEPKVKTVAKFVLKDGQLDRADSLVGKIADLFTHAQGLQQDLTAVADAIAEAIKSTREPTAAPVIARPIPHLPTLPPRIGPETSRISRPAAATSSSNGHGVVVDVTSRAELSKPLQRILDAYAWWHSIGIATPSRENIAPLAGYSNIRSSGFRNPLYELHTAGLIADDALTERGKALAAWPEKITSLQQYHEKLKQVMDGPEQKLFDALHVAGGTTTREQLATATDYTNVRSSGFRNPLYRLSSMGLVVLKNDDVTATALMYPAGLVVSQR